MKTPLKIALFGSVAGIAAWFVYKTVKKKPDTHVVKQPEDVKNSREVKFFLKK